MMNFGFRTFDIQCSIFDIHYKYPIVVIPEVRVQGGLSGICSDIKEIPAEGQLKDTGK